HRQTGQTRFQTLFDVLHTQGWTDGTLFNNLNWRNQRTGTQQQRELTRFVRVADTGNTEAVTQTRLDVGDVNHLFLFHQHSTAIGIFLTAVFVLHEQGRHRLADVVLGEVRHD